ncbi:iron transporter [Prauserella marina]|uniref:Iron complex transport system substrate-binding protein n=1 Tax=Prauserella marina TaxID=530584 RepID=A0A222VP30_9PSEU|nr:ABC transporter substrate-binding protein [Prauserella marina]ASR35668.1 iron transporter [Prauserella marina]PWV84457.1 iron complex transport system substrate-binding protein [Prauserella marina]SDC22080.1 iron complex transport system substrate-binding protein [Prauserella marina]
MLNWTRHRRAAVAPVTAATLLLLTACGAQVQPQSGEGTGTTTVNRCGEPVEYTVPQRAVVYEGGSADKMFALGLTEHVHGYVMPPANPPVSESPWASEYEKVEFLSDDLLNRELVVDAGADFVVAGWNSGFSDSRGITPEILDTLGIQSFLHAESCFNYPGHPERHTPFDGLYTDLERLGEIFGVPDRASKLIAEYQDKVDAVREQAPGGDPVPVFLYDSGTDKPLSAASQVPPNDIIRIAGGTNIFGDVDARWFEASWEAVVEAQPEVVIILDYGDQPAEDKIAFLKNNPVTANIPAVEQDRFFVLDYNEAISSPRIVDGLEKFAEYLRDDVRHG